jgi:hypothetical protein
LLLVLPYSLQAQAQGSKEVPQSLRGFVQGFYDWYVPKALSDDSNPAWNVALKTRGRCFSSELALKLREDSAAQAKAEGEIVGLDFDPFLGSQDPGKHYEVSKIAQKDESYWVDIHSVSSGKRQEKPSVIAEVVQKNGQWLFVNFHYPDGRDLLGILKSLRESRETRVSQESGSPSAHPRRTREALVRR